eukprot:CAMPEP_0169174806 /NCGR_PEP_ID=MMETSP1015-20121227/64797_1 /TAXON_ID=342587 /ORGANISM="Karlodinium micrum, Strain CCMP2283" /LENGTH=54 /DNA_ID=CAMNT_0009248799 /DNA_START=92 /DNA_END=253 /DNA_ORIENTATION=-
MELQFPAQVVAQSGRRPYRSRGSAHRSRCFHILHVFLSDASVLPPPMHRSRSPM